MANTTAEEVATRIFLMTMGGVIAFVLLAIGANLLLS